MTPETKAAQVFALLRDDSVLDLDRLVQSLERELQRTMLRLRGNADRDLASVRVTIPHPSTLRVEGFGPAGTRRLDAGAVLENREAEVMIILTKGDLVADLDHNIFGATGEKVGNAPLLPRLLDVVIPLFVAQGIHVIVNHPVDPRVRAIYTDLGFAKGERLALDDLATLRRVFETLSLAAQRYGLDLCPMPA
jgi:hypothetical protein